MVKEFADDNFKFDENGEKLFNRVENTVVKGQIARNEQFLLFSHSVFKRLVQQTRKNKGLFGNGLKEIKYSAFKGGYLDFSHLTIYIYVCVCVCVKYI